MAEENITMVITICAVLHNLCEDRGLILPQDPSVWRPLLFPPMDVLNIDRHQYIMGTLIQALIAGLLREGGALEIGIVFNSYECFIFQAVK